MTIENVKFGQIPAWAIRQFGRRHKIEIVVFSVLCLNRFRSTRTAEMTRGEIIEQSGLDKAQVSRAIKGLKRLGWVEEKSKTLWFIPEEDPSDFVVKSTTKEKKVDESSTKSSGFVDEMTTNSEKSVDDLTTDGGKVDESTTNEVSPAVEFVDEMTTAVDELTTVCCQNDNNARAFKGNTDFHTIQKRNIGEISLSARAREENSQKTLPEKKRFDDGRSGYSVHELMNFRRDPEFLMYTNTIVEGLKIRHGTKARLPNRDQWEAKIEAAWENEFPAGQCLEVYDLLVKIRELRDGDWNITPRYWEENIPRINQLRRELEKLEKRGAYGQSNKPADRKSPPGGESEAEDGRPKRRLFQRPAIKRLE